MRVVVDYLGSETFSPNHFSPIFASSPFSLSFFKPSQKPNAKIKAIKGDAEQNKSAFAFSKSVDDKVVSDFNDGLMLELLHLMRVVVDYLGSETFSPNHFSPIFASSPFSQL
jgi:hypothetical protein